MSMTYDRIIRSFSSTIHLRSHYLELETIDLHTCGEPLRVLLRGTPNLVAGTILEKRQEMRKGHDWIRQTLMFEPRGHHDMYGCVLTAPERGDSDFGVIFMHNEGYSTMCGHAIIALTKLVAEFNWKEPDARHLKIDAPCGQIESSLSDTQDQEFSCTFQGVPSFVLFIDQEVSIPEIGLVMYDIAYGGAFYAYVDADSINLQLVSDNTQKIRNIGRSIKSSILEADGEIRHPFEEDLSFLYGVMFYSRKVQEGSTFRNVCVFADGEIDRSPTGSGFCGMLALLSHRKRLEPSTSIEIESIIGTRFSGSVTSHSTFGEFPAIIPSISGSAFIMGKHRFLIDPSDPLKHGFLLK